MEDFLYSVVVPEPPADGKAKEFCILYKGSTAIVRTLDPVTLGRGLLAELEGLGFHERDDAVYVTASIVDVRGSSDARARPRSRPGSRSSVDAPESSASVSRAS